MSSFCFPPVFLSLSYFRMLLSDEVDVWEPKLFPSDIFVFIIWLWFSENERIYNHVIWEGVTSLQNIFGRFGSYALDFRSLLRDKNTLYAFFLWKEPRKKHRESEETAKEGQNHSSLHIDSIQYR